MGVIYGGPSGEFAKIPENRQTTKTTCNHSRANLVNLALQVPYGSLGLKLEVPRYYRSIVHIDQV
jgi:hypothetical protein